MMIGTDLLFDVFIVEVAILMVALVTLFGHAIFLNLRESRFDRLVAEGRQILANALQDEAPPDQVATLSKMPGDVQLRLFEEIAPALLGIDRRRLARLAQQIGLDAAAERQAKHRAWWRRLRALRVLTLVDAPSEVAPLLLKDEVPEVAAQAADWASEHPTPAIVEQLILMLADDRVLCRFSVQDALLRIGAPAIAPLAEFLDLSDDGLLPALRVARRLADPAFLDGAERLSRIEDGRTRAEAVRVLGSLGGRRAADRLTELLDDPEEEVRAAAAEALGYMGHWAASPQLVRAMSDAAWSVRRAAGLSLSRLGAPGNLMLRKTLTSGDAFASDMANHILDLSSPSARQAVVG